MILEMIEGCIVQGTSYSTVILPKSEYVADLWSRIGPMVETCIESGEFETTLKDVIKGISEERFKVIVCFDDNGAVTGAAICEVEDTASRRYLLVDFFKSTGTRSLHSLHKGILQLSELAECDRIRFMAVDERFKSFAERNGYSIRHREFVREVNQDGI